MFEQMNCLKVESNDKLTGKKMLFLEDTKIILSWCRSAAALQQILTINMIKLRFAKQFDGSNVRRDWKWLSGQNENQNWGNISFSSTILFHTNLVFSWCRQFVHMKEVMWFLIVTSKLIGWISKNTFLFEELMWCYTRSVVFGLMLVRLFHITSKPNIVWDLSFACFWGDFLLLCMEYNCVVLLYVILNVYLPNGNRAANC